ncbi:MAG TPA: hypothetical protein VJS38_18785, partial [Phenylobacterium sp.]|uniref:hypothetical protein n=1 Tax=Phenylobacterium sp. TaxID=1871053 RepID=UPI002B496568
MTPNICAMNSAALKLFGFDSSLPDEIDDVFPEKDADGQLTGIFRGRVSSYYNSSMFWLTRVMGKSPMPEQSVWYRGGLLGQRRAASRGVTSAYEAHAMEASHLAAYQQMRDDGALTMRQRRDRRRDHCPKCCARLASCEQLTQQPTPERSRALSAQTCGTV